MRTVASFFYVYTGVFLVTSDENIDDKCAHRGRTARVTLFLNAVVLFPDEHIQISVNRAHRCE